jgi:FkbM family methyltransferase
MRARTRNPARDRETTLNSNHDHMAFARYVRRLLPPRWQPVARFHYERLRGIAERELPIAIAAVQPGDRVADIGASHGVYTHAFARRRALVEAFEPQPGCVEVLRAYAAVLTTVRVHAVALGAEAGVARLETPPAGAGSRATEARVVAAADGSHPAPVQVVTLDSLGLSGFSLMKIDVEGAEADVLRGAARTLECDRPLLLIEIEQRHHVRPIAEVFALLNELDYDGQFLDARGRARPLADFVLERDQQVRDLTTGSGVYINNFFFSPQRGSMAGSRRWFGT